MYPTLDIIISDPIRMKHNTHIIYNKNIKITSFYDLLHYACHNFQNTFLILILCIACSMILIMMTSTSDIIGGQA